MWTHVDRGPKTRFFCGRHKWMAPYTILQGLQYKRRQSEAYLAVAGRHPEQRLHWETSRRLPAVAEAAGLAAAAEAAVGLAERPPGHRTGHNMQPRQQHSDHQLIYLLKTTTFLRRQNSTHSHSYRLISRLHHVHVHTLPRCRFCSINILKEALTAILSTLEFWKSI